MKALLIQMQIVVLENARASLIKYHNEPRNPFGLCFHIHNALYSLDLDIKYTTISECIPLFRKENANKFQATKCICAGYWWPIEELKKRIAFLDWMINELKQQL